MINLNNIDESLQASIIVSAYVIDFAIIDVFLFIDVSLSNVLFARANIRLRDVLTKQN